MFKILSRPFFFCVSQSLPCSQGLFWADNAKYQLRAKIQRIEVCLSVTQMKRHFVRNLCSSVYGKCLLSSGLVVAHKPLALLPFQPFPASSRDGMLHLLVVLVCSSLPLDSNFFTYLCPLWAVFSLLLSVLLWGGP